MNKLCNQKRGETLSVTMFLLCIKQNFKVWEKGYEGMRGLNINIQDESRRMQSKVRGHKENYV